MGRSVNAAAALGVSGKLLWFACPPVSGATWGALSSWTEIGNRELDSESTPAYHPWHFYNVHETADSVWVFSHRPSTGIRCDRLESSGTFTASAVPSPWNPSPNYQYGVASYATFVVSSDNTRIIGHCTTWYPSVSGRWVVWDGTAWTTVPEDYWNGALFPGLIGTYDGQAGDASTLQLCVGANVDWSTDPMPVQFGSLTLALSEPIGGNAGSLAIQSPASSASIVARVAIRASVATRAPASQVAMLATQEVRCSVATRSPASKVAAAAEVGEAPASVVARYAAYSPGGLVAAAASMTVVGSLAMQSPATRFGSVGANGVACRLVSAAPASAVAISATQSVSITMQTHSPASAWSLSADNGPLYDVPSPVDEQRGFFVPARERGLYVRGR